MQVETPYNTRKWRGLSRSGTCAVGELLGTECSGRLHLHHVHPLQAGGDQFGRTVPVCEKHHPSLEALARRVWGEPEWKHCTHTHPYPGGREECERRLNAA